MPTLEKYQPGGRNRYTCPYCGKKKKFTRYVDENGQYYADHVGICASRIECGKNYTPSQYFADHPEARSTGKPARMTYEQKHRRRLITPTPPPTPHELPGWLFLETQTAPDCNFIKFLTATFGRDQAQQLRRKFSIGSNSDIWPNSTVFWILDKDGKPYAAQVINYDETTGKTVKIPRKDGNVIRRNSWLHTALKQRYNSETQPIPDWLNVYDKDAPKFPLPFGFNLLADGDDKPVAIVEAAKTCVIMTGFEPDASWLGIGSLSYLTAQRLEIVKHREIVLYPDLQAYDLWKNKAVELRRAGFKIVVSDLLEQYATAADYKAGLDIADFYLRQYKAPIQPQHKQQTTMQVVTVEAHHAPADALPPGWSRNNAGELCDQHGLTILDWGLDPDPTPIEIETYANECNRYLITVK